MAASIRHKRGDTFSEVLILPETDYPDGYFLDWDVASQIRTVKKRLIADAEVNWVDPAEDTRALRIFVDDTRSWPIERLRFDVQFTRQSDGWARSTETVFIDVMIDETIPPAP